jgi:isopentenyl-diphosphate delta-isomerase
MDLVILVNEKDEEVGVMEKLQAHRKGLLHRAFSVFLFNSAGQLLLQRRAEGKYHSGGLWTNTCCSHPRPGESIENAAVRRLKEEMGITCDLKKEFSFIYHIDFGDGLYEHELDHVFTGICDIPVAPNPDEVMDWQYIGVEELKKDLKFNGEKYTKWFRIVAERVMGLMERE